ncbi:MAG: hypothetical protein U0667_02005 [Chloroflexota bacterium]
MADRGESIVFISHKLDEVVAIADRVTVLRRGAVTAEGIPARSQTRRSLAPAHGRPRPARESREAPVTPGEVVLRLDHVSADSDRDLPALRGVSLEGAHRRDALAIAGVTGNGQTELAEVVTGLRRCRHHQRARHGHRQPAAHAGHRQWRGPRPRGSPPHRQRAGPVADRQPHHEELPSGAHRATVPPGPVGGARQRQDLTSEYQVVAPSVDTQASCCPGATSSG